LSMFDLLPQHEDLWILVVAMPVSDLTAQASCYEPCRWNQSEVRRINDYPQAKNGREAS